MSLGYIYSESEDVAYFFSQAGIFCLVEMTAAILVFTAPTVPKPMGHLANQVASSMNQLLRSNTSSLFYRTRNVHTSSNVYVHIDEHGNAVPLAKLRSAKSKVSVRSWPKFAESEETGCDSVV